MKFLGWVAGAVVAEILSSALSNHEPQIRDVEIIVEDLGDGWYVGQERTVRVNVEASFGYITGNEEGKITLEVDFDGEVAEDRAVSCTRKYTKTPDGDGRNECHANYCGKETCTLPGKKRHAKIPFRFNVEATDHGNPEIYVKVSVRGDKGGWAKFDKKVTVTKEHTKAQEIKYPLLATGEKIGHLNPGTFNVGHGECKNQKLEVHNKSTDDGQIQQCRINKTTRNQAAFDAAESNDADAEVTTVVEGIVGHVKSSTCVTTHPGSQSAFYTDWTLAGTDNIRLFLDSGGEWTDSALKQGYGGEDPSDAQNFCDGSQFAPCCNPPDSTINPTVTTINSDFQLMILSLSQPSRVAANRPVGVTDSSSFDQTYTTNESGVFTINAMLGPLVTIDLVPSAGQLYVPRTLTNLNVALLDSSPSALPYFDTFYITEKVVPEITGTVKDNLGNDLDADIFAIDQAGAEAFLGSVTGTFDIGPFDLSLFRTGSTNVRVTVEPQFDLEYTVNAQVFSGATDGSPIALNNIVFTEVATCNTSVTFKGTFRVLTGGPPELASDPIVGLEVMVEGVVGVATTNASGFFSLNVPAPPMTRNVSFPNVLSIAAASGFLVEQPFPEGVAFPAAFGRSGCTLDLGTIYLDEDTSIPAVSEWGLVVMGLLTATAGTLVLRRRWSAI